MSWLPSNDPVLGDAKTCDALDLIINLVASGYGVALVPRRALALYRRKESLVTLPLAEQFEREIVVLTRKHRKLPPHVAEFVKNILF